jgi:hypothetical protein
LQPIAACDLGKSAIAEIAERAKSGSVRMAALRSILSDMMSASEFAGLEQRITEIKEQLHELYLCGWHPPPFRSCR